MTKSEDTLESSWNIFYRLEGCSEIAIAVIEDASEPEQAVATVRSMFPSAGLQILGLIRQEFSVDDLE